MKSEMQLEQIPYFIQKEYIAMHKRNRIENAFQKLWSFKAIRNIKNQVQNWEELHLQELN